jgi:SAM-dependent methyltransferase
MGLGRAFLDDLIELKRIGALLGARSVAEIGAQQLSDTLILSPNLDEAAQLFDAAPLSFQPVGMENFTNNAPLARPFWQALGFQHASIDIAGSTIRLDLNNDRVPRRLRGAFDLVINAGTTEHLANQANAFRVIHDLTRPGGLMYHELPGGGCTDHGFVAYQPKFFSRLMQQNDYQKVMFKVVASPPVPVPTYIHEYNRPYGDTMPESVSEIALRIALRKRGNFQFSCPIDDAPQFIPEPHRSLLQKLRTTLSRIKRDVLNRRSPHD